MAGPDFQRNAESTVHTDKGRSVLRRSLHSVVRVRRRGDSGEHSLIDYRGPSSLYSAQCRRAVRPYQAHPGKGIRVVEKLTIIPVRKRRGGAADVRSSRANAGHGLYKVWPQGPLKKVICRGAVYRRQGQPAGFGIPDSLICIPRICIQVIAKLVTE